MAGRWKADIAKYGSWQPGPGYDLFKAVKEQLGDLPIIAEDLGNIDDKARKILSFVIVPPRHEDPTIWFEDVMEKLR